MYIYIYIYIYIITLKTNSKFVLLIAVKLYNLFNKGGLINSTFDWGYVQGLRRG